MPDAVEPDARSTGDDGAELPEDVPAAPDVSDAPEPEDTGPDSNGTDDGPEPPDEGPDIAADGADVPDVPPDPCELVELGMELVSVPACAWTSATEGLLGPDPFATLAGYEGNTCIGVAALSIPENDGAVTLEWTDHRKTTTYSVHEVRLDGEVVETIEAGVATLPRYRQVTLTEAQLELGSIPFSLCAPQAVEEEVWEVDDFQLVAGKPPVWGEGFVPETVLELEEGVTQKLQISVSDPDVVTDPFVYFPKFEAPGAPEWTVWGPSVIYGEENEMFHQYLSVSPPKSAVGETFTFQVVVTDIQGLHASRWFSLTITD